MASFSFLGLVADRNPLLPRKRKKREKNYLEGSMRANFGSGGGGGGGGNDCKVSIAIVIIIMSNTTTTTTINIVIIH